MTEKEFDKLKPGDIVIDKKNGREWKFIKICYEMLDDIILPKTDCDNFRLIGRCNKYILLIDDYNENVIELYNFMDKYTIKEMENEIKLKVPEGKKAVQTVDTNGNIVIKFENVEPIRSKSWDEFCKNHPNIAREYWIQTSSDIGQISEDKTYLRHPQRECNLLSTKEDAEGILALIQLTRLHDEWVGDWEADWKSNEYKYVILHDKDDYAVRCAVNYHRLFVFPTEEMAEEFKECFKELLDKAKKFI